ncbi:MAG: helix-turn-helix domain-containing protein [Bacteroidia bacterium]
MRSKIAERMLAKMPEDIKIFTDKYADLVVRINAILKEKGYTQKSLADKLDKKPSEIHKWLSGEHNFTLRSIAKLEAELGETLIEVSKSSIKNDQVEVNSNSLKLSSKSKPAGKEAKSAWSKKYVLKTSKVLAHAG